jgi:hypothetical protein
VTFHTNLRTDVQFSFSSCSHSSRLTGEKVVHLSANWYQKAPALRAPEPGLPHQGETLWEDHEASHPEIVVQDRHAQQIEERLIQALSYVQEHGVITNGIYRQLTGVTDRTAHRDLERLVERGR